jgi:hypothetical protein
MERSRGDTPIGFFFILRMDNTFLFERGTPYGDPPAEQRRRGFPISSSEATPGRPPENCISLKRDRATMLEVRINAYCIDQLGGCAKPSMYNNEFSLYRRRDPP